jgi:hypothetical protein
MGILTVASSAIQWLMLIQPEIHAWRNKDKLHTRCQMGFASVVLAEPCLYKYYSNYSLSLFPVAKGFLSCFKFVTACPVSLLKKCLFGCAKSMAPSVVPRHATRLCC